MLRYNFIGLGHNIKNKQLIEGSYMSFAPNTKTESDPERKSDSGFEKNLILIFLE